MCAIENSSYLAERILHVQPRSAKVLGRTSTCWDCSTKRSAKQSSRQSAWKNAKLLILHVIPICQDSPLKGDKAPAERGAFPLLG